MSAPFGIEFYSPAGSLEVLSDLGETKYIVAAPRPHPRFEKYVVQATPNLGVVWVKGISYSVANDAFGEGIRQLRQELSTQVSKRYGLGKATDFLLPGSIWSESRDYVMSLTQNQRSCNTSWERPLAVLPDDIEHVFLCLNGVGSDTAWLGLEYYSPKQQLAVDEVQDALSDLL